ncbi:MAG: hypothetical protein CM1200mP9_09200 [Gammaproteobacteria bacterium]|nr:MAG: hypothetical protein CM1200mP9_09200 [Gammaproteobacteria bacterium]
MGPAGGAPLWQNRDRTVGIGSYTALVCVCLNDQTKPGKGQFSVREVRTKRSKHFFVRKGMRGAPLAVVGPLGHD